MMRLFINSLAASAGGGLTYIRNVAAHLAQRNDVRVTIAVSRALQSELLCPGNVDCLAIDVPGMRRYWFEQSVLPGLIRRSGADVLLSTGNFALRRSPVPQVLLSRNSIYISPDYYRDLLARREYRLWIDTRFRAILAKKSVQWANVTVAPSEAFAAELRRWTHRHVLAIHHGFDPDAFRANPSPLSNEIEKKLAPLAGCKKILFVSHYNYYRNFETLFRALPTLQRLFPENGLKVLLTCELKTGRNPGAYRPEIAAKLVNDLGLNDVIVELGSVPYQQLHHLYARADVYVTPAYTETFAHPLIEAMASRVPVIASDIPVHREVCGPAALYFPRFSPEELAASIGRVLSSPDMAERMKQDGLERSQQFSWSRHVDRILEVCRAVLNREQTPHTHDGLKTE